MPRRVDHQQRRTEIVYAVWAVAAADGLDAVTLRRVAAEAGISLGRVQHYFADKEELLLASCAAIIEVAATSFAERTADCGAIETLGELVAQPVPRSPEARIGVAVWQAFAARAVSDPGLQQLVVAAVSGARDELARLIVAAQTAGDLPAGLDPVPLARALYALGHGLAQQVLVGALDPDEARAAVAATLGVLTSTQSSRSGSRSGTVDTP